MIHVLEKVVVGQLANKFRDFTGPEYSLLCLQKPVSGLSRASSIQFITSNYAYMFQVASCLELFTIFHLKYSQTLAVL